MKPFTYNATVTSIYDADTIKVDIDLGFGIIKRRETLRLYGINAPEVRGKQKEKGLLARDYLRSLLTDKDIIIKTLKDKKGKYGRYIAVVYLGNINVNELLVERGFAVFKDY